MEDINNNIKKLRFQKSFKTNKAHVKHVKEIIENKKNQCPKCGSNLVERTIKKGERAGKKFMGCSSFPKCRYISVD